MVGGREREKQIGKEGRRRKIERHTCTIELTIFCLKETGLYAGLLAAAVPLQGGIEEKNKLIYCTKEKNK